MAKILHVEDRGDWRDIMAMVLEGTGHELTSCATMQEAKQAYQPGKFYLVICDGTVDEDGDGQAWGEGLHAAGQKTVIVSGDAETNIPFVRKGSFEAEQILVLLK